MQSGRYKLYGKQFHGGSGEGECLGMMSVCFQLKLPPQSVVLLVGLLLRLTPAGAVSGQTIAEDVTVRTTVVIENLDSTQVLLAGLLGPDGANVASVYWAQDTSGWFATWGLQLSSAAELLPQGLPMRQAGSLLDDPSVELKRDTPSVGHEYEVTLSYSASLGALAISVYDLTDARSVYTGGFAVPGISGVLHAMSGTTQPVYVPVGASWSIGTGEPGASFLPMYAFTTRHETPAIRIRSAGPLPQGTYRVYVESHGASTLLASIRPRSSDEWVELPLLQFPLGELSVRVDYEWEGQTLLSQRRAVTVGRLDFLIDTLAVDRAEGVAETNVTVTSIEPLTDDFHFDLEVTLFELQWNAERRVFDKFVAEQQQVYSGPVDLSTGMVVLPVQVSLPDRPGNWSVYIEPRVTPRVPSFASGQEHLFSTHLPAQVAQGESYTIAVFPDTQYMAQSYPHVLTRMSDWVTSSAAEKRIAAVLHVGDITNDNAPSEWQNAYASMSLLHDVVMYALTLGNHDMVSRGGVRERGMTRLNDYFTVDDAERYSNLGGTMLPNLLGNHYSLFSIGGTDYLVISLEYGPPSSAP